MLKFIFNFDNNLLFDGLALTRVCDMTKNAHRQIKQMVFYDYKTVNVLC